MLKVSQHLHQEGMLEFDGPMGAVFQQIPTGSSGGRGKKEEERYEIEKKYKSN